MRWMMFFKNIAMNRDYIYNFCNNPNIRFQKHFYEWYLYNLSKNNTAIYHEGAEQHNLNQLQFFMFYLYEISSQIAFDQILEKVINQIQR